MGSKAGVCVRAQRWGKSGSGICLRVEFGRSRKVGRCPRAVNGRVKRERGNGGVGVWGGRDEKGGRRRREGFYSGSKWAEKCSHKRRRSRRVEGVKQACRSKKQE